MRYLKLTKSKLFYSILLTYIFIIIIPLVVINIKDYFVYKYVKEESEKVNLALMQEILLTVDSEFEKIYYIENHIRLDEQIDKLVNSNNLDAKRRKLLYIDLIEKIKLYQVSNNFIDNIFIYVPEDDIVLTEEGTISLFDYYTFYYNDYEVEFYELLNMFNTDKGNHLRYIKQKNSDYNYKKSFINKIQSDMDDRQIILGIDLNDKAVDEIISNFMSNDKITFYITNDNNDIINKKGLADYDDVISTPVDNNAYIELNKGKDTISMCKNTSQINSWKYFIIVPSNLLFTVTQSIKKVTLISTMIYVLLSIILSYIFTRRNYIPLSRITSLLKLNSNNNQINEYSYITNSINEMQNENIKLRKNANDLDELILSQSTFLLVVGRVNKAKRMLSKRFTESIYFKNKYYVVVNILLEADSSSIALDEYNELIKDMSLSLDKTEKYICEIAPMNFAVIFNMDGNVDIMQKTKKYCDEVIRILHSSKIMSKIAISSIGKSVNEINKLYNQTLMALDYCEIAEDQVIEYNEIKELALVEHKVISAIEQNKIYNYVDAKDIMSIKSLFSQKLSSVKHCKISNDGKRLLVFFIINTMQLIIDKYSLSNNISDSDDYQQLLRYTAINAQFDVEHVIKLHSNIFGNLEKELNISNIEEEKILKIIKYINNNYKDIETNASHVAYVFSMSSSSLSKFFKNNTGKGVIEYINEKRIAHTKKLLNHTSLSLNDIAKDSGFLNSHSLIRIFKKVEGITPNKYRDIHKS